MPFTTLDEKAFPVPVLAQVSQKEFEICVPFKYRRTDAEPWTTVPDKPKHKKTDLASVPGFLLWLVPRYGAHTLAALLHDQLVHGNRPEADTIFRDALGELKVPLIRRWFMWAAVSLATMFDSGWLGKLKVIVWGLFVGIASLTFWQHMFSELGEWKSWSVWIFGQSPWGDLAIVALASLIFFPRIVGLVAGAGAVFIFVATVFVLLTLVGYVILEAIARVVLAAYNKFRPHRDVANNRVLMTMTDGPPQQRGCPELASQTGKTR